MSRSTRSVSVPAPNQATPRNRKLANELKRLQGWNGVNRSQNDENQDSKDSNSDSNDSSPSSPSSPLSPPSRSISSSSSRRPRQHPSRSSPPTANGRQRKQLSHRDSKRTLSFSSSPSSPLFDPNAATQPVDNNSPSPPRPSQRASSSINAEFVDPDSISLGSGFDDERRALDAGARNSERNDSSYPAEYIGSVSNTPSSTSLLDSIPDTNHVRNSMHSIMSESSDIAIHFSESQCFDNLQACRNLYRVIPPGARTAYIGAYRTRLMRFGKAYDTWVANDRTNNQPLFDAYMSLHNLPRDSLSRMRSGTSNTGKCHVLNRRFESIIAELEYDDELRRHPESQSDDLLNENVVEKNRARSKSAIAEEVAFNEQAAVGAERFVKHNHLSKAMKRLCKKLIRQTKSHSQVLNDLRALHPQRSSSMPRLPVDSPVIVINPDDPNFYKLMKHMDNGSSPGLSGMTGNMLAILADDVDCRRFLAQLVSAIINGDLPDNIRRVLLASHLIGIPKPNNGTRPIAIGEVLYRFAARYALSLIKKEDIKKIFLPHQFGVDISAGCETVVHTVQQALSEESDPYYVLCIDMKNAFNEVKRDEMMKSLFSHRQELDKIFRLAHWCYSAPTPLITKDGVGHLSFIDDLQSTEGTRQGANESSLLFALPLQPLLKQMSEKFIGLKIASILDDVTLMHRDVGVLLDAFDWLKKAAEEQLKLVVQPAKCQFIYFNHTDVDRLSLLDASVVDAIKARAKICVDGACLLGTAVGRTDDILHRLLVQQIGTTHDDMFKRLLNPKLHIQAAMLMLRQCMIPKLNYILRTVRPSATARITELFDQQVLDCGMRMLEINREFHQYRDEIIAQLRLPCRMSGFGLRSMSTIASFAYLDSTSRALHLDHITNQLFTASPSSSFKQAIDHCINFTKDHCSPVIPDIKKLIPASVDAFLLEYRVSKHDDCRLQSTLTHEAEKQQFLALRTVFSDSDYHSARLLATSARGAALWKVAVPLDQYCRLTDSEYIIATRVNLGMQPCEVMPNICGKCRRRVGTDDCSTHALSCNYLKGTLGTVRHDTIQKAIVIFACRAGCIVREHQRTDRNSTTDKRTTDFTLYHGRPVDYDVTCRHPTCPTEVHSAAKTQLITASKADHEKRRHHHLDPQVSQANVEDALRQQPDFRSFSCESYGGLHADAAQLISDISILAQERPTVFTAYEVKYGLGAAVACAIQRYNAAMILENINQAAQPAAQTAPTYHATNHHQLPLSSTSTVRRTHVHRSAVRPVDTQLDAQSAISDVDVSLGLSRSSSAQSVTFLPPVVDVASVSVPARLTSSTLSLVRALSVDAIGSGRSVRSTFSVDNRSSMVAVN
jgi:hypothetical protein